MSLSKDELLSIYHSARAIKEGNVQNNPGALARVDSILGPVRRELGNIKECSEFHKETKKCLNSSCENGLHHA